MSDVTTYIDTLTQDWQIEIARRLHEIVHQAIPDVTERLQYGKPHYLNAGQYACVLSAAKGWISFTIFNATALDAPDGFFEDGPPERKTIKIRPGQDVNYVLLATFVQQAASTIG